eukprot:865149_1
MLSLCIAYAICFIHVSCALTQLKVSPDSMAAHTYGGSLGSKRRGISVNPDVLSSSDKQAILDRHNLIRDQVASGSFASILTGSNLPSSSDMNQLLWDPALAALASSVASTCIFAHTGVTTSELTEAPTFELPSSSRWLGENLAVTFSSRPTPPTLSDILEMMQGWIDEGQYYQYGIIPRDPSPTDQRCTAAQHLPTNGCGHFTQIVWADTRYVGCGFSYCGGPTASDIETYLVCHYYNAGNFQTRYPYDDGGTNCAYCAGDRDKVCDGNSLCGGGVDSSFDLDGTTDVDDCDNGLGVTLSTVCADVPTNYPTPEPSLRPISSSPTEYPTLWTTTPEPTTSFPTTLEPTTPQPTTTEPTPFPTTAEPTTPQPTTPSPVTPAPTTPEPTTPEPTTADPTTHEPTTGEPTTPAPVTPVPTTPEPTTAEPTTPEPTTPDPTTPEPTTGEPTTPAPITPAPTTPAPVTPEPTTAQPTTAEPTTSEPTVPITPSPITPEPTIHNEGIPTHEPTPQPITPAPITPAPVTPEPTTAQPTTPSPITPQPTTSDPTTPAPITPSPTTPTPISTTSQTTTSIQYPGECVDQCDAFSVTVESFMHLYSQTLCITYRVSRLFDYGECVKSIKYIILGLCGNDASTGKCSDSDLNSLILHFKKLGTSRRRRLRSRRGAWGDYADGQAGIRLDLQVDSESLFELCLVDVFLDDSFSNTVRFKRGRSKFTCDEPYLHGLPCLNETKFAEYKSSGYSNALMNGETPDIESHDTVDALDSTGGIVWALLIGCMMGCLCVIAIWRVCVCVKKRAQNDTVDAMKMVDVAIGRTSTGHSSPLSEKSTSQDADHVQYEVVDENDELEGNEEHNQDNDQFLMEMAKIMNE